MGIIFDKPLLASVEYTIKDKTFVLYELSGADYWDHVLSAASFTETETEAPKQTDEERYQISRSNAKKRLQLTCLSIQPGYPDAALADLKKEISTMLSMEQQQALYAEIEKLMGWTNPNGQAPDADLSTD